MRTLHNNKPWEIPFFQRGRIELFTGGWVSCCWVPKRDDKGWTENFVPRRNSLKSEHLPDRKGWAFYRTMSELLLSPKEGWRRMKLKLYAKVQLPEKRAIFLRERVELFTGGWVSYSWVSKRDDAENKKNDKTDEESRKGKYKYTVWWNLIYKKVFFILR